MCFIHSLNLFRRKLQQLDAIFLLHLVVATRSPCLKNDNDNDNDGDDDEDLPSFYSPCDISTLGAIPLYLNSFVVVSG